MVQYAVEEGTLVCRFDERMDTAQCLASEPGLFEQLGAVKGLPVVFDLAKTLYISSVFLGICMRAVKESVPGTLSLVNLRPEIKRVFKVANLDSVVPIR